MSEEIVKKSNWGKPFAIIALVFGILSLINGTIALIPLVGLVFAVITMILSAITLIMGIPGVIGTHPKGVAITALVFGVLMLTWALIRYFWVLTLVVK